MSKPVSPSVGFNTPYSPKGCIFFVPIIFVWCQISPHSAFCVLDLIGTYLWFVGIFKEAFPIPSHVFCIGLSDCDECWCEFHVLLFFCVEFSGEICFWLWPLGFKLWGSKKSIFEVFFILRISSRKWSWWKNFCSMTFRSRDIEFQSSHTFTCILYRSLCLSLVITIIFFLCNLIWRIHWWKNYDSSIIPSESIFFRSG